MCSCWHVAVSVLCLFVTVPLAGLCFIFMAFPGHTTINNTHNAYLPLDSHIIKKDIRAHQISYSVYAMMNKAKTILLLTLNQCYYEHNNCITRPAIVNYVVYLLQ